MFVFSADVLALCALVSLRRDGKTCRLPRSDAAGKFSEFRETVPLQQTGGDRRTVAGRAVHNDRAIARKLREPVFEPVQRHIQAEFAMSFR